MENGVIVCMILQSLDGVMTAIVVKLDTLSNQLLILSTVEHINAEAYCKTVRIHHMPQICCTTVGYPKIRITKWLTACSHCSCRHDNTSTKG